MICEDSDKIPYLLIFSISLTGEYTRTLPHNHSNPLQLASNSRQTYSDPFYGNFWGLLRTILFSPCFLPLVKGAVSWPPSSLLFLPLYSRTLVGWICRREKTTHKNRKSNEISCFEVLYVLF